MLEKEVFWVGSSKKDLKEMPDYVQDVFGFAIYLAQIGQRSDKAKPFKIMGESGLTEIVEDYDGDTYRAVYTVRYGDAVYVLHCFQKKSPNGIKTSKNDVDLVIERLKRLKLDLKAGL